MQNIITKWRAGPSENCDQNSSLHNRCLKSLWLGLNCSKSFIYHYLFCSTKACNSVVSIQIATHLPTGLFTLHLIFGTADKLLMIRMQKTTNQPWVFLASTIALRLSQQWLCRQEEMLLAACFYRCAQGTFKKKKCVESIIKIQRIRFEKKCHVSYTTYIE